MPSQPYIEDFLIGLPAVRIIGGSPLYRPAELPPHAISINGRRPAAFAAAINSNASDARRVKDCKHVMVPAPTAPPPPGAILPANRYRPPPGMPPLQPTTCFSLLLICQAMELPVELLGVCGWASKWHDGDWEMHYIKRFMPNVTVHDPRPRW